MTTTHTPGPWRYTVNVGPTRALIVEGDGSTVCEILNPHRSRGFEGMLRQMVRDHNAAPDLLAALQNIVACVKMTGPAGTTAYIISDERMHAAHAAIAKAKGE